MSKITGLKCIENSGKPVLCDAFGNNVAFQCPSCKAPVLAIIRKHQRGSSPGNKSICASCERNFWIEIDADKNVLILHQSFLEDQRHPKNLVETIDNLEIMEGIAARCITYEHYFTLISQYKESWFWPYAQNAIGESVCLAWGHLFGNWKDNFHYSNFFRRDDVVSLGESFSLETIKTRLSNRIHMNEADYLIFWEEVKSCRDKFIAHKDLPTKKKILFPRISLCRETAEELRLIFSEIVEAWLKKNPENIHLKTLDKRYKYYTNDDFKSNCRRTFYGGIQNMIKMISKLDFQN